MIKQVELSFENCEFAIFPYDLVEHMSLTDVTIDYRKTRDGNFMITRKCKSCHICLNEEANKGIYSRPLIRGDSFLPFDRILNCADIVSVALHYDICEKEEFYMNYVGHEVNELQRSTLTKKGNLLIQINCGDNNS